MKRPVTKPRPTSPALADSISAALAAVRMSAQPGAAGEVKRGRGRPPGDLGAARRVAQSVSLPVQLWQRIAAEAARLGITRSAVIERSLSEGLRLPPAPTARPDTPSGSS